MLEPEASDVAAWLEALRSAAADESFDAPWRLYRAGQTDAAVRERVLALLSSANDLASWRAAAIASLWGEVAAAPRLLRAIQERAGVIEDDSGDRGKGRRCEVPVWLISVSLLRAVGTPDCLPVLDELASDKNLLHNARTAIALCCEGIAVRHELSAEQSEAVLQILWRLIEEPAPNSLAPPQRALMATEFDPAGV